MIWVLGLLRLAVIATAALALLTVGLLIGLFGIAVRITTGSSTMSHVGAELIRMIERLPLPAWSGDRTFVYLLQDGQAATKIGISGNPRERIASLETGHPEPLRLVKAIRFRNAAHARAVERDLHIHFERKRMNGEWFDLSDRQVRRAVTLARRWR
ncbi:MAG: GIY-YIG nuclease family protein [Acidimicrobiia bacterium]|nr:GIY-YIG nuclease family protein [Acidimicrobiia bacterium]